MVGPDTVPPGSKLFHANRVGDHGTAIADRDDLTFGLRKILRKEGCELLTIGWH